MRDPDISTLRALVLVADKGSISAAARSLGTSQQAVSLRLRALEVDLSLHLLARSAQGSELTASGEFVVEWARNLVSAADAFAAEVIALGRESSESLRIVASRTVAEYLLPTWISRWRRTVGGTGPIAQLVSANSTEAIRTVRSGEAHLGFIETPDVPHDLKSLTVGFDTIVIVVSIDHLWAELTGVTVDELAGTPLVLREVGSGTRRALEVALESAGTPMRAKPVLVVDTTLDVRSAAMAGIGPAALSSLAVQDDLAARRLAKVTVSGLTNIRPITAIWTGGEAIGAVRSFLDEISQLTRTSRRK